MMADDDGGEQLDPECWKKAGWIAQVLKNEDDDGWAVSMTRVGDDEPALVGPWTMGRDKKNPKPLDASSFATLVKTATEVLQRHEATARERLHKFLVYSAEAGGQVRLELDIVPDDDDPHAMLTASDAATGEQLRRERVPSNFKLSAANGERFVAVGVREDDEG
jgi:hypothetical protein